MKTVHTPGPWSCDTSGQPIIVNGPQAVVGPDIVALVYDAKCPPRGAMSGTSYYGEETAAANARLVTAAPDLLGVLEKFEPQLADTFCNGEWDDEAVYNFPFELMVEAMRAAIARAKGKQ